MRAIFIDFDGVLHQPPPPLSLALDRAREPDYTAAVELYHEQRFVWLHVLAEILDPHQDVAVIVHSSWRLDTPPAQLLGHIEVLGRGGRMLDVTRGDDRYESILDAVRRLSITNYRILDDEARHFRGACAELIECPPDRGVSSPAVQRALRNWLES